MQKSVLIMAIEAENKATGLLLQTKREIVKKVEMANADYVQAQRSMFCVEVTVGQLRMVRSFNPEDYLPSSQHKLVETALNDAHSAQAVLKAVLNMIRNEKVVFDGCEAPLTQETANVLKDYISCKMLTKAI